MLGQGERRPKLVTHSIFNVVFFWSFSFKSSIVINPSIARSLRARELKNLSDQIRGSILRPNENIPGSIFCACHVFCRCDIETIFYCVVLCCSCHASEFLFWCQRDKKNKRSTTTILFSYLVWIEPGARFIWILEKEFSFFVATVFSQSARRFSSGDKKTFVASLGRMTQRLIWMCLGVHVCMPGIASEATLIE